MEKYLIGNAHLDPAWLWPWQEGYGEVKSTFTAAMQRMEEFPEFIFTCSSAAYYKWMEEDYPEIFEMIKEYVKQGKWNIAGGWWVQPDCNIPCGEVFARHSLYGQNYFKSRFGKICKTGYNVDSFGHNASLPQILRNSGMEHYVCQRPSEKEMHLEQSVFHWMSRDGSCVTCARLTNGYATNTLELLKEMIQKTAKSCEEEHRDLLLFYGVGNHGGGPTAEMLRYLSEQIRDGNSEQLRFSDVDQYFSDLGDKRETLPILKGDLQHHASGCYSAHSELKKKYRRAENALLHAEKYAILGNYLCNSKYNKEKFNELWESLLFNTFHDILCGCSIKPVCDEALNQLGSVISESETMTNRAVQAIASCIDTLKEESLFEARKNLGQPIIVFNPHSWDVTVPVRVRMLREIDSSAEEFYAYDSTGNKLAVQPFMSEHLLWEDKDGVFLAEVPTYGYKLYYVKGRKTAEEQDALPCTVPAEICGTAEAGQNRSDAGLETNVGVKVREMADGFIEMENERIIVRLERLSGLISCIIEKASGRKLLSVPSGTAAVYEDWENDTWAHGNFYFNQKVGEFQCTGMKILEQGPVRCIVKADYRYGESRLSQRFILYQNRRRVRVEADAVWYEKHKILKLLFPTGVTEESNTYQIPFGTIRKECTGEEQVTTGWFDITGRNSDGEKCGILLLSDSKYSFSAEKDTIGMTALRSAIYADHGGKRKPDLDYDYLDQGNQSFTYEVVPHSGEIRHWEADRLLAELNTEYAVVKDSYHKGELEDEKSFCHVNCDNIIISSVKRALADDSLVIRAYESEGRAVEVEIQIFGRSAALHFSAYEVKTFKIDQDNVICETDFTEMGVKNEL